MPTGPKGQKRPADVIGNAVHIMRIATGEIEAACRRSGGDRAAPEAGRERAFFKTRIDEDGDLYVTGGLEFPIWIRVDENRKLITFLTYVCRALTGHPPFTEALENRLNATVILPSFYVVASEPDRLYATYHASYEDGMLESHVVGMARFFAGACVYGARVTMTTIDEHVLH